MLIRVGSRIINLDNVLQIDLEYEDEEEGSGVAFEFVMREMDQLDEGQNIAQPYIEVLWDEEAAAVRKFLMKRCPDLMGDA
jgi:hypothetical protein